MKNVPKGWFYVTAQFLLLIVIALSKGAAKHPSLATIFGAILFAASIFILIIAVKELRPSLTALPEPKVDAPLITTGIYGMIRHPMYLAVIMMAIGMSLVHWSMAAAIETVLLVMVLGFKLRYEDLLLHEKWPDAHDYQKSTGAVIPKFSSK